jgi:hypothetical protein
MNSVRATSLVTTSDVLSHMRKHKRHWKCAFLAEQLGVMPDECRNLLYKLIRTGEVSVVAMADLRRRYVLTEQLPAKVESTVTPPPYVNVWTAPMRGYDAAIAARTAMAMGVRG